MDQKRLGWWKPEGVDPELTEDNLRTLLFQINKPVIVYNQNGSQFIGVKGEGSLTRQKADAGQYPITGFVQPAPITDLGSRSFCSDYGIQFPCLSGSMANGISSVELVKSLGNAGMLGFLGTAGLELDTVAEGIHRLKQQSFSFGCNLIHSPHEPYLEEALVDLYLQQSIHLVEASAYMDITLPLIKYRVHGIHRDDDGKIVTPNRIIAKASRVEVARRFFSPPPEKYLRELVEKCVINEEQANMASRISLADDLTAEADSGGHTDNRSLVTLFPIFISLRNGIQNKYNYEKSPRVGAAGGIATPYSAAAAFAMGASYILIGSVFQSCIESGTSDLVRQMLAQTAQAEIAMAPAADMFEMGVRVQVLKRGTMFAMKAAKLYDLYRQYSGLEQIPSAERVKLEKMYFKQPIEAVWEQTKTFFSSRDPKQVERAENEPKHKMALVFRWYLGKTSHWANAGVPDRKIDYQIWCGPAMGAFNQWVSNTFLEAAENREVVTVALNILWGAAVLKRAKQLESLDEFPSLMAFPPFPMDELKLVLNERN